MLAMRLETPFELLFCSSHPEKRHEIFACRCVPKLGQQKPLSVSTRIRKSKPSILFVTERERGGAGGKKEYTCPGASFARLGTREIPLWCPASPLGSSTSLESSMSLVGEVLLGGREQEEVFFSLFSPIFI